MSAGQTWSARSLDPKAREIAKDLALRAGMSLGDWLHQVMVDEGLAPPPSVPVSVPAQGLAWQGGDRFRSFERPPYDYLTQAPIAAQGAGQLAEDIGLLASRLDLVDRDTAQGLKNLDQSVEDVRERLTHNQGQVIQSLAGFDAALNGLRSDQAQIQAHLDTLRSDQTGVKSLGALRSLEGVVTRVIGQMRRDQGRAQLAFSQVHQDLGSVKDRIGQVETVAQSGQALARQADANNASLSLRLQEADLAKDAALGRLDAAITQLHDRIRLVQAQGETEVAKASALTAQRFGTLSDDLQNQLQTVRGDISRTVASEVGQKFEAVHTSLDQVGQFLKSSDQRTSAALDTVGSEIVRLGSSLDQRLALADRTRVQSIDRLKGEITRVIERISERVSHSERRAAQASEDVGKQVARATDHIAERAERSANDLADRVRQSEDRIAYLLDEARARLERHLVQAHGKGAAQKQAGLQPSGAGSQLDLPASLAAPNTSIDPFSSTPPDWNEPSSWHDPQAGMSQDLAAEFDAKDFAFELQQVEAAFTNGFDDPALGGDDAGKDQGGIGAAITGAQRQLPPSEPIEDLDQTWSASWSKAVL